MDVIWQRERATEGIALQWLGQAGFAVRCGDLLLLIDPYLSDSLAKKYRGKEFPHIRMMPPPVDPSEIRGLNHVFCSHRHSDHMDPETLPALAQTNPDCKFTVPRAEVNQALDIGLNESSLIPVTDGDSIHPDSECAVDVIPSAHEELRTDGNGDHHYLGFVIRMGGVTLYHSGDCVPYEGLSHQLREKHIDVALLPVNGRDSYRQERGVPGNFSLAEAVQLCKDAQIPILIAHHFGMFEFNTIDVEAARKVMSLHGGCILPQTDRAYALTKSLDCIGGQCE